MYAKVFVQMYDGTLCTKGPWQALVTFQQLLVLADMDGNVDMTAGAIARRTTIPLEIIEEGIKTLLEEDPESRTPTENGRRIVPLAEGRPWGWKVVNYKHYRSLKREEDRREYHREYWHKRKQTQTQSDTTQHTQPSQPIAEANAEAIKEKRPPRKREAPFPVPEWINREHWDAWHSCGKRKNATNAQKQMAVDKLDSWRQEGIDHNLALENAAIGGWQGLFKPDGNRAGGVGEHKYAAAHKAIFGNFV